MKRTLGFGAVVVGGLLTLLVVKLIGGASKHSAREAEDPSAGLLRQRGETRLLRIEAGAQLWTHGELVTENELWRVDVDRLDRYVDTERESHHMYGYADSGPCSMVIESGRRSSWLCRPGSATGMRFWLTYADPRRERRPSLGIEEAETSRRIMEVTAPPAQEEQRGFETFRAYQEELGREFWKEGARNR
jgi:hypothetical protein